MRNIKSIVILSAFTALITLTSWGDIGHSKIAMMSNLSFNEEMSAFNDWIFYLSEHSSDADWRKKDDPNEGPKHYIDIDNYDDFINEGRIPQTLDSCISAYGNSFVEDNGYLPWATLAAYDSVKNCMKRGDFLKARTFAADLSHYVADGHMPLHITRNYDGQFSGNKGIHARYEIYMIERFQNEIDYQGSPAKEIIDTRSYVFSYLYENYEFINVLLKADDFATEKGSGNSSDIYYNTLWEETKDMTNEMLSRASHSFAELLYTAWIEAGRPQITPLSSEKPNQEIASLNLSINPNPVKRNFQISYLLKSPERCSLSIYDIHGRSAIEAIIAESYPGKNYIEISTNGMANGTYFLVLQSQNSKAIEAILLSK